MQTNITWSKNTDQVKKHYEYLLHKAQNGWYQERGFLIMPYLERYIACIVIPRKFESTPTESFFINDAVLQEQTQKVAPEVINKIHEFWGWGDEITNIDLEIYHITFGTGLTFDYNYDKNSLKIILYVREGRGLETILNGITSILALIKTNRTFEGDIDKWRLREELGEFILLNSNISKHFNVNAHKKTLDRISKNQEVDISIKQESLKYEKELGVPANLGTKLDWSVFKTKLSKHEYLVANIMYQSKNTILTYNQLLEAVYQDDFAEKFSLQYIAKVIQEIRQKIKSHGIQKDVIFTQRGIGYGWFS